METFTRCLEIRRKSADNKGAIPFEGVKSFNKVNARVTLVPVKGED